MATADEILATMTETEDETAYCTVDIHTRSITIPSDQIVVGVESDEDVVYRKFRMLRMMGDIDLSLFTPRINFMNANNVGDIYLVSDLEVDGDYLTFSWLLSRNAMAYKGTIQFVVCFYEMDADDAEKIGREWNSTVGKFTVLEGLETTAHIEDSYPDVIEYILANLGSGGGTVGAQINDSATSASSTWSSRKISTEISSIELTPGPTGPAGYTPVRGTDYWTQDDRAEIIAGVLAALPNASGVSF